MTNTVCIYTALFGDYEPINNNIPFLNGVDLLCFTDSSNVSTDKWITYQVDPAFPSDCVRSQRHIKVCPHLYEQLSAYQTIVYVDNSIHFSAEIISFIRDFEASGADLLFLKHSFRSSLYEEFLAVYQSSRDKHSVILSQFEHYLEKCPALLNDQPIWGGIIIRSNFSKLAREFNDLWFSMILRYSARDQLSLPYALSNTSATVQLLQIDNFKSAFHTWPHIANRKHSMTTRSHEFLLPFPVIKGINASLFEQKLALEAELFHLKVLANIKTEQAQDWKRWLLDTIRLKRLLKLAAKIRSMLLR